MFAYSITQGFQVAGLLFGVVLSLGGIAGMAWAVARVKGLQTTVELIAAGNAELNVQLESARDTIREERHACAVEIANLQGQLTMLTSGLAEQIIRAVTESLMKGAKP